MSLWSLIRVCSIILYITIADFADLDHLDHPPPPHQLGFRAKQDLSKIITTLPQISSTSSNHKNQPFYQPWTLQQVVKDFAQLLSNPEFRNEWNEIGIERLSNSTQWIHEFEHIHIAEADDCLLVRICFAARYTRNDTLDYDFQQIFAENFISTRKSIENVHFVARLEATSDSEKSGTKYLAKLEISDADAPQMTTQQTLTLISDSNHSIEGPFFEPLTLNQSTGLRFSIEPYDESSARFTYSYMIFCFNPNPRFSCHVMFHQSIRLSLNEFTFTALSSSSSGKIRCLCIPIDIRAKHFFILIICLALWSIAFWFATRSSSHILLLDTDEPETQNMLICCTARNARFLYAITFRVGCASTRFDPNGTSIDIELLTRPVIKSAPEDFHRPQHHPHHHHHHHHHNRRYRNHTNQKYGPDYDDDADDDDDADYDDDDNSNSWEVIGAPIRFAASRLHEPICAEMRCVIGRITPMSRIQAIRVSHTQRLEPRSTIYFYNFTIHERIANGGEERVLQEADVNRHITREPTVIRLPLIITEPIAIAAAAAAAAKNETTKISNPTISIMSNSHFIIESSKIEKSPPPAPPPPVYRTGTPEKSKQYPYLPIQSLNSLEICIISQMCALMGGCIASTLHMAPHADHVFAAIDTILRAILAAIVPDILQRTLDNNKDYNVAISLAIGVTTGAAILVLLYSTAYIYRDVLKRYYCQQKHTAGSYLGCWSRVNDYTLLLVLAFSLALTFHLISHTNRLTGEQFWFWWSSYFVALAAVGPLWIHNPFIECESQSNP